MEDNAFFDLVVDEGRLREARDIILRQGRRKFGEPDAATVEYLKATKDRELLEELTDRIFDATSWASLLANSPSGSSSGV